MTVAGFSAKWIKFNLIILFLAFLAVIFINYLSLFSPFIISFVIAFIFYPVIDHLERYGINRVLSVVLLYFVIFLVFLMFFSFIFPFIKTQVNEFVKMVPSYKEIASKKINELSSMTKLLQNKKLASDITVKINSFMTHLTQDLPGRVFSLVSSAISLISFLVLIPFITFLLLVDGKKMKKYFIEIVPNRYFEMTLSLVYEIDKQLRNYLKGILLDASIVCVLVFIGLFIMGIKYGVVIGIIAGVSNIIPYIGPFIGASIAIIITLFDTPVLFETATLIMIVKVAAVFIIVQQIDSIFISPNVVGKSVNLHPLLVLIALLAGAQFMGVFGMLLSIPLLSTFLVTFRVLYKGFKNYRL